MSDPTPILTGDVTLYHGDCLSVLASLPDGSVDAVVTDPPYLLGSASARKSADKAIGWADINNASFWYSEWMRECWRCLKASGCLWVFANWRSLPVLQCAASKIAGMSILSVLVWDKDWPSVGSMRGLRQQYEIVVLFGRSEFCIPARNVGDIWKEKWSGHKPTGHPQEKPVALVERLLTESSIGSEAIIVDPFMGSGTVGVAALKLGCRFVGVELDDQWFTKAQERITKTPSELVRVAEAATPLFAERAS
jgi:site-specific DNA-methyltransferase (adenine-specific)